MTNKSRNKINKFIIFAFLTILCISLSQYGFSEEKPQVIDWKNIKKSWDAYIEYPSSKNLEKVFILLPYMKWKKYSDQLSNILYGGRSVINEMLKDLWLLEKEAYSGNVWAVRVLHKLLTIVSGWSKEKVLSILGNLIRINPSLFLEEMSQQIENIDSDDFHSILCYMDTAFYTDKIKAKYREIDLRIKSLEIVKKDSLNIVKKKCLEDLMEKKKGYEGILGIEKKPK